jgi:hypothetical protein
MKLEVELVEEDGGLYRATAVLYPEVSGTGRTEKEALGLLLDAVAKYLKSRPEKSRPGRA